MSDTKTVADFKEGDVVVSDGKSLTICRVKKIEGQDLVLETMGNVRELRVNSAKTHFHVSPARVTKLTKEYLDDIEKRSALFLARFRSEV